VTMGKISEALEKATKENSFRRLGDKEQSTPLEKADAAQGPKSMHRQPVRAPELGENAPAVGVAPAVESPVVVGQPAAPPLSIPSMHEEKNAGPDMPVKRELVIPEVQPKDGHVTKNTIAVAKPSKPAEATAEVRAANKTPTRPGRPGAPPGDAKAPRRGDIQINYSRTKVQASDLEKLKNNKIFSIFDDIEITDQIKILRTQVLKKLTDIGGNSILVTSANPYEGKTFTCINLGVSIAKEFKRTVLIIDADLRKPTKRHTAFSTEFFTLDVDFGLTDYLKGEAEIPDILINPGINKLTLIPSGKPVYNAPELLSSSRMEEMMAEIKNRYPSDRLIIVDGPAILPFPDAMILSRYVDGVLPVVEVGNTPADKLKKMMELLKETRVLGTVMNKNKE
jgi:protein-tyrosine kinase